MRKVHPTWRLHPNWHVCILLPGTIADGARGQLLAVGRGSASRIQLSRAAAAPKASVIGVSHGAMRIRRTCLRIMVALA